MSLLNLTFGPFSETAEDLQALASEHYSEIEEIRDFPPHDSLPFANQKYAIYADLINKGQKRRVYWNNVFFLWLPDTSAATLFESLKDLSEDMRVARMIAEMSQIFGWQIDKETIRDEKKFRNRNIAN